MSCAYKVLSILDGFLCLFVFFPLAIFHWRGTWGLQDVYFYPEDEKISGWISFVVGGVGGVLLQFIQPYLFRCITPSKHFRYYVTSRLYMYVSGWVVMCYWRGVWDSLDAYLTEHWLNSVIIMVFTMAITLALRMSRNNVGLPFSVCLDSDEDLLMCDTVFKVKSSNPWLFLCDICFTQFVIVTANICVWRGIWNVLDSFLFPHDKLLSDLTSLGLGYLLCVQLFLLQWPAGATSRRLDKFPLVYKLIFEDAMMFAALLATLLLWRGGWDLCVDYVIPDPLIGGWICHWVGTIGLTACQTFNVVAMNGIEKDGEALNGEGIFPTSYLRLFFKDWLKDRNKTIEEEYLIDSTDNSNLLSPYADDSDNELFSDEDTHKIKVKILDNGNTTHYNATKSKEKNLSNKKTHEKSTTESLKSDGTKTGSLYSQLTNGNMENGDLRSISAGTEQDESSA